MPQLSRTYRQLLTAYECTRDQYLYRMYIYPLYCTVCACVSNAAICQKYYTSKTYIYVQVNNSFLHLFHLYSTWSVSLFILFFSKMVSPLASKPTAQLLSHRYALPMFPFSSFAFSLSSSLCSCFNHSSPFYTFLQTSDICCTVLYCIYSLVAFF